MPSCKPRKGIAFLDIAEGENKQQEAHSGFLCLLPISKRADFFAGILDLILGHLVTPGLRNGGYLLSQEGFAALRNQ